jgi:formaldehyde-activating enzyme involved in methanogenesis
MRSSLNSNNALIEKAYMDALTNRPKSNTPMLDSVYPKQKTTKGIVAGQEMEFTPEQMKSIFGIQKKGGSVKSKKK